MSLGFVLLNWSPFLFNGNLFCGLIFFGNVHIVVEVQSVYFHI